MTPFVLDLKSGAYRSQRFALVVRGERRPSCAKLALNGTAMHAASTKQLQHVAVLFIQGTLVFRMSLFDLVYLHFDASSQP